MLALRARACCSCVLAARACVLLVLVRAARARCSSSCSLAARAARARAQARACLVNFYLSRRSKLVRVLDERAHACEVSRVVFRDRCEDLARYRKDDA